MRMLGRLGLCRVSLVPVMETADFRNFDHPPFLRRLCRARRGCVLFQGQMRSRPVVAGHVRSHNSPQMRFPEHHDMIEALRYTLHARTLPGTVRRNDHIQSLHSFPERPTPHPGHGS